MYVIEKQPNSVSHWEILGGHGNASKKRTCVLKSKKAIVSYIGKHLLFKQPGIYDEFVKQYIICYNIIQ